jgi:hypothetical protein
LRLDKSREVDMYLHILLIEEYKTFGVFGDLFCSGLPRAGSTFTTTRLYVH